MRPVIVGIFIFCVMGFLLLGTHLAWTNVETIGHITCIVVDGDNSGRSALSVKATSRNNKIILHSQFGEIMLPMSEVSDIKRGLLTAKQVIQQIHIIPLVEEDLKIIRQSENNRYSYVILAQDVDIGDGVVIWACVLACMQDNDFFMALIPTDQVNDLVNLLSAAEGYLYMEHHK